MASLAQLFLVGFVTFGLYYTETTCHETKDDHVQKRILIQDNYYSIMSQLEALTKQVDLLTAQNHNLSASSGQNVIHTLTDQINRLTEENRNLSAELGSLKAKTDSTAQEVSFKARLTKPVAGTGRYIHYDNVILNIGNAYNPNHGVFVAPVSGTYQFSLYGCATGASTAVFSLMLNQTVVGNMLTGDNSFSECNSRTFLLDLTANDDVYVKTHASVPSSVMTNAAYGLPSFSGILIRKH